MIPKLLIAGGGTGGHIFPGIAIAEEWQRRGGAVVFVGTTSGQESLLVPKNGFDLKFLKVGRLKGGGILQKLKTLMGLPSALIAALRIIKNERPGVVLGIGGYASGPALVAARLSGIPTAITDQNVHPGFTNRVLGKIVQRIFLSFDESASYFPKNKVLQTGNPVRSNIGFMTYRKPQEEFRIFIFGGSQGAVAMNEKFLEALALLPRLWKILRIFHQAGATDFEKIKNFYAEKNITATVQSFFDNMNEMYAHAHLVVCRAGAGTLTELALSGRPSILVPYPFAADDHQTKNAQVFVKAKAAWMFSQNELGPSELAGLIESLYNEPEKLVQCSENARGLARPDAQKMIVDDLLGRASQQA